MKVITDRYTNRKTLSPTPRTIVTADPKTEEGRQLSIFATQLDKGHLQGIFHQQQQPEKFIRKLAYWKYCESSL